MPARSGGRVPEVLTVTSCFTGQQKMRIKAVFQVHGMTCLSSPLPRTHVCTHAYAGTGAFLPQGQALSFKAS